MAVRTASLGP